MRNLPKSPASKWTQDLNPSVFDSKAHQIINCSESIIWNCKQFPLEEALRPTVNTGMNVGWEAS